MTSRLRIGVDLGGTKIEAIALTADGRELARQRVATPRGDYGATVAAVRDLVRDIETAAGASNAGSVGVAIPGAVSPATGRIKNANSTWLIGERFDHDLGAALDRPVRIANDANCFVLSEAQDGAGADARCVFGVIIGTGTGGGLVIDGSLHEGPNLIAGEWGHVPLPWRDEDDGPARPCYCGKVGCIETFLSGPGFAHGHADRTGESLTAEEIVVRARRGDKDCLGSLARYERTLSKALAMIVTVIDPDVIVLGGGMSNIRSLYDRVPTLWQSYAFSDQVTTMLRPAQHGDSSGVRGAAWLWPLEATT